MVALFAFLYLPIVTLVVLSFNRSGLPTSWGGLSLDWYRALAPSFWTRSRTPCSSRWR
jgi:ABC-type spermidine/putrescine transport system permease subunit II